MSGIARGSPAQARRIASRGGLVLLVLWVLTLLLVMLVTLALPPEKGGSFYATTALTPGEEIDWLNLYIPANPFWLLANNVVPAVIVFSVLLGIALLGVPDKSNANGAFAEKLDYWIRGKGAEIERAPRWSFARNVLGWSAD